MDFVEYFNPLFTKISKELLRDSIELSKMQSLSFDTIKSFSYKAWIRSYNITENFIKNQMPEYSLKSNNKDYFFRLENDNGYILVNPLDGFNYFCRGWKNFSYSIAIFEKKNINSYEPRLFMIFNPYYSEIYSLDKIDSFIVKLNNFKINTAKQKDDLRSNIISIYRQNFLKDEFNFIINENLSSSVSNFISGKIDAIVCQLDFIDSFLHTILKLSTTDIMISEENKIVCYASNLKLLLKLKEAYSLNKRL